MVTKVTPVSSTNVDALVVELQTIGDRLEARGIQSWLTIARAAFILSGIRRGITKQAEVAHINVQMLVIRLEELGDQFQDSGNLEYRSIVKAASLIEGLRLGVTTIADDAPTENWFGIDLATGPDQTVWRARHAH